MPGTDVAGLTIPVPGTENGIDFGAFISAIINFLIVAWVVFMIVKAFNKMKDGTAKLPFRKNAKGEEVIEHAPTCPFCLEEINVGATRLPPLHRRAARPGRSDHRDREEVAISTPVIGPGTPNASLAAVRRAR